MRTGAILSGGGGGGGGYLHWHSIRICACLLGCFLAHFGISMGGFLSVTEAPNWVYFGAQFVKLGVFRKNGLKSTQFE